MIPNTIFARTSKTFAVLLLILLSEPLFAGEWNMVYNLKGKWKFTIGDNKSWASDRYNDFDWEQIYAPAAWEDKGFHGYDGYAWYRKTIKLYNQYPKDELFLCLGYIDDVDEVYFNGELIGFSGQFPPSLQTAYNAYRRYRIPKDLLRTDRPNVIAVRVYDSHISGGIVKGDIGIYKKALNQNLAQDLSGVWDFRPGDLKPWESPKQNQQRPWSPIMVPSAWEYQGYKHLNGYAWYQKSFTVTQELASEDLVLLLGKIDDCDQVFLNGKKIGATGLDDHGPILAEDPHSWQVERAYPIPAYTLLINAPNILHVRVHDWYEYGGIFEGEIGLAKN